MALGQQNQPDTAAPYFSVDADIAPLRAQFFDSAAQRAKSPGELAAVYQMITNNFGSIQQARDIQNERMQKDEDRAIQNQLRNTQLDASRFELAQARDKVREKQQSLAQTSGFLQGINQIKAQFAGDPAAAYSAINDFGAQNASAFENPTNKNAFELTLNSLRTPAELRLDKEKQLSEGVLKAAADAFASGDKTAAKSLGLLDSPIFGAYVAQSKIELDQKGLSQSKKAETAGKLEVEKTNRAVLDISKRLGKLAEPESEFSILGIDAGLKKLNEKSPLSDEDKAMLSEVGITAGGIIPKPSKSPWPTATNKTEFNQQKSALTEKQRRVIADIAAKYEFGVLSDGLGAEETTPTTGFKPKEVGGKKQ